MEEEGDLPVRWTKTDDSEARESNVFSEDKAFLGWVLEMSELS